MARESWRSDSSRPRTVARTVRWATLGLALLLLTGCRLDVVADVTVAADGTGAVGLVVELDRELLGALDELEVDPTAELEAAAVETGWEVVRSVADEGLRVTVTRPIDDLAGIGEALRELSSGLDGDDPALLVDLEVAMDAEGGTEMVGTAGFRAPETAGVRLDGDPVGPDAEQLAALVAASVSPRLTVELPGRVFEHDGDRLMDRTVSWELPVGDTVEVRAVAAPPRWWDPWVDRLARRPVVTVAVGAAAVLLVVGSVAYAVRRRDQRTGGAP